MITADSANFQSINMIRDELVTTIEQAARDLEVFISDDGGESSFEACLKGIQQILGILRMLELKGASILAEELYMTAKAIRPDGSRPLLEKQLELVSNTFFVLTRYLEYVQKTDQNIPVLLVPYINELRKFRREPLLPESFFFDVNLGVMPSVPALTDLKASDSEFVSLVVRLRHMYELGLLGSIRGHQLIPSLKLMKRSVHRLQRLGNGTPLAVLWWMSAMVIDAFIDQKLELIEPRKMLLSRIDRIIRQVQKGGKEVYNTAAPKGLIKELLYLVLLSGVENKDVAQLKQVFGVAAGLPYSDKELNSERSALQGPSTHTINSLVRVLRIEVNNIKKVLEAAAQGIGIIDDVDGLVQSLGSIAETLAVVGLVGPSSILKEDIKLVAQWSSVSEVESSELQRTAKVLLYMESAVNSLEHSKLSAEALQNTSEESQHQIISSGELALAERIVLTECVAGIALTKRALTSYSESGFDAGHIINVAKTLNSVCGGLVILNRSKAASVVAACVDFINTVLLQKSHPPELKELLETFADAVISIEYFLDSSDVIDRLDDSMLQVAEESLDALGFAVS